MKVPNLKNVNKNVIGSQQADAADNLTIIWHFIPTKTIISIVQ